MQYTHPVYKFAKLELASIREGVFHVARDSGLTLPKQFRKVTLAHDDVLNQIKI